MFHTFLTLYDDLSAVKTAFPVIKKKQKAPTRKGWRFLLCVLLGEREKSHKDWLPFG